MISLPSGTRIWLVAGVTDMRKSFNGLGEQIQHVLDENPFSGHLFIFRGRRGDMVKILWADADGLCLCQRQDYWPFFLKRIAYPRLVVCHIFIFRIYQLRYATPFWIGY